MRGATRMLDGPCVRACRSHTYTHTLQVVMQKQFWVGIWEQLVFPALWLLKRKSIKAKVEKLNANRSTRKLANDATYKALGFLCVHLIFLSTFVVWRYAKHYVHADGDFWTDLETSGAYVVSFKACTACTAFKVFQSLGNVAVAATHCAARVRTPRLARQRR